MRPTLIAERRYGKLSPGHHRRRAPPAGLGGPRRASHGM